MVDTFGFERRVDIFDICFVEVLVVELVITQPEPHIGSQRNLQRLDRRRSTQRTKLITFIDRDDLTGDTGDKLERFAKMQLPQRGIPNRIGKLIVVQDNPRVLPQEVILTQLLESLKRPEADDELRRRGYDHSVVDPFDDLVD